MIILLLLQFASMDVSRIVLLGHSAGTTPLYFQIYVEHLLIGALFIWRNDRWNSCVVGVIESTFHRCQSRELFSNDQAPPTSFVCAYRTDRKLSRRSTSKVYNSMKL